MDKVKYFKEQLRLHWYVQGFNGVPLFLNPSSYSGFEMKKELGYGYTRYLFNFKKGWGEMYYLSDDFDRLWKLIKAEIDKDPDYLFKVKQKYQKLISGNERFFKEVEKKPADKVDDANLVDYLKRARQAQTDAVSLAHIDEPIGMRVEDEFKKALKGELRDKNKFNNYYTALTRPTELSFITREEQELLKISKVPQAKRKKLIAEHAEKYSWIQNSYVGPKRLTTSYFEGRIKKGIKEINVSEIKVRKKRLINSLNLSSRIQDMIEMIDFTTVWQDQRKANILKSINYLAEIAEDVSKRTGIDLEAVHCMGVFDIKKAKSLEDIKGLKNELVARSKGVFFSADYNGEISVTGKEYRELVDHIKKDEELDVAEDLHGSIANPGTAVGKVKVCNDISEIPKVKKDDILVASMTRPEYMPAIKKAAAIVTDEGGVTCHAAIVSREMHIPCIVGTKKATKLFKDGDTIEVRANHGLIRKLK